MLSYLGKLLIALGILLLILGLILYFSPSLSKIPGLKLLGRLPGDIKIERDGFRFYFPLATSILISILMSLILFLLRFFKK